MLVPTWFAVHDLAGAAMIMLFAGSVVTISGLVVASRGLQLAARAARHLHAVTQLRQLPTARARLLGP